MAAQRVDVRRIGIRELRNHFSQVLREVREDDLAVDITVHGQVVAELRPKRVDTNSQRGRAASISPPDELHLQWREDVRRFAAAPPVVDLEENRRREEELDQLAQRLGERWPKGLSAVDAIRQDRVAE